MAFENRTTGIKGSIFSFLSAIFKKHQIRCVLVGGYALNAHNVQRMTFDIDFILTADDYSRIEPDLIEVGYSIVSRQAAFAQLKGEKPGLRDIDFLIGDAGTVNGLLDQATEISIAGETFFVPSVELNLPRLDKKPLPPSRRTMDEINEWIEQDYALFFNRPNYEKQKRLFSVNVPFVL